MTPAMRKYLSQQQVVAMNAEAVAHGLELLTTSDYGNHEAAQKLAAALVGMLADLNEALDSVNLIKVDAS